jgi:phosphoserine phosphatase
MSMIYFCDSSQELKQTEAAEDKVQVDPLPSWVDGERKSALIDFVEAVTDEDSPDFVVPSDRIATFDNDGTLWSEKPYYFQLDFALDRVKLMARNHPEWENEEPFASAIRGDVESLKEQGLHGLIELITESHAGLTNEEFENVATNWLDTAKHPVTGMLYKDMIYKPMLEVLEYLRANDFKVFIVTGGGINFVRCLSESTYGVSKDMVVGSYLNSEFKAENGEFNLVVKPEMGFVDDGPGKPVAIGRFIGRRPIAAFGNSDGDLAMLQYASAGEGRRLMMFVHHTDAEREYAYDRESSIGKFDKGLDYAKENGWLIADMKSDWKVIYPSN